ncbi:MAG: MFS transporter [Eubacteriales bacterium]
MKRKNVIPSIIALSLLLMSGQALNPGLASLMTEYGVSESTVVLLATIPPLAVIPGTFIGSFILRHFSKKIVGIAASILIAVSGALPVFISNFTVVLVTRVFVGIGLGFINCLAPSLPSDYYPPGDSREKANGIHGAFAGGGGLIFSSLAGWLCSIQVKAIYLVYLICLIPAAIVFLTLPDDPPTAYISSENKAKSNANGKNGKGKAFDSRILPYAVKIFIFLLFAISMSMNISQLVEGYGIGTVADAGIITAVFSIGGFIVGFTFSQLMKALKEFTLSIGTVLAAIGILLVVLTRSIPIYCMASVISGVGFNIFITACVSDIGNKFSPEARTVSFAIVMSANHFAQFMSPIILDPLSNLFGGGTVIKLLIASLMLFAFSAFLFLSAFLKNNDAPQKAR